jgi:phage gpG-like protein
MKIDAQKIMNAIRPVIADQIQKFPILMQVHLAKYIKNSGSVGGEYQSAPIFNTGNQIYSVTGGLWKSFVRRNSNGNVYKFTETKDGAKLVWGTNIKYAAIHEYGGFIKGTPITVLKTSKGRVYKDGKTTTKMSQFFWWRYSETKSPFFKILALSSHKNKGVNIKARPYFQPALDDFKSTSQQTFKKQIENSIVETLTKQLG